MEFSDLLSILIGLFEMVCLVICFTKMGADGWAALIPIYNLWTLCEYTWGSGWMVLTFLIPFIGVIFILATYVKMFRGFGKSIPFCIFGLFFSPIALAICAFDSSTYCA